MEYSGETAVELTARGYRRVSNKYLTISRVDRPDWKYVLAKTHIHGLPWVAMLGKGAPDSYRRGSSKDLMVVPEDVFRGIPGSSWDTIEYVDDGKELSLKVKREYLASLAEEAQSLRDWIGRLEDEANKLAPCMKCRKDGFACETCGSEVFYKEFECSRSESDT